MPIKGSKLGLNIPIFFSKNLCLDFFIASLSSCPYMNVGFICNVTQPPPSHPVFSSHFNTAVQVI